MGTIPIPDMESIATIERKVIPHFNSRTGGILSTNVADS